MQEETILWQHTRSDFLYVFGVKARDLILNSCTEKTINEEVTIYNSGYPYIRLPETYTECASWEYVPCDNIRVSCISRFTTHEINGGKRHSLHVERTFEYSDSDITETYQQIECYVEGLGIQSKYTERNMN